MHFNIHNSVCNKPQKQRGRSLKKYIYICCNNLIKCHWNILIEAFWNPQNTTVAKKLNVLSFFPFNSWPYSIGNSTYLTYDLNRKGAQPMKTTETKRPQLLALPAIEALRVFLQSPHAAEGCHLTQQGDTPTTTELLGTDMMIKQISFQICLIIDRAEFLRGRQVSLH